MAHKVGFLDQLLWGDHADRSVINRNAEALEQVGASLGDLRDVVQSQANEIMQLRALMMGLVETLQARVGFTDAELQSAVRAAWDELAPPPPVDPTDPYRGTPAKEASEEDIAAALRLLDSAQELHYSKRFKEARDIYQQIVEKYPDTEQADTARQQLKNLKRV